MGEDIRGSKRIGYDDGYNIVKTVRAYLKHYPTWKYYDLSLKKQRQLIIQKGIQLPENEIAEKLTHDLPKKNPEDLRQSDVYDLMQGASGIPNLKNEGNTKKVVCYWYIDLFDKENINLLYDDYETSDLIVTADFVTDFSKYDCEPDVVVTENTKESKFYQNICELIRSDEHSYKEIAESVSTDNFRISHTQIGTFKKYVHGI